MKILPLSLISAYHKSGLPEFKSIKIVLFVLVKAVGTLFSKSFASKKLSLDKAAVKDARFLVEKYFAVSSSANFVLSR